MISTTKQTEMCIYENTEIRSDNNSPGFLCVSGLYLELIYNCYDLGTTNK